MSSSSSRCFTRPAALVAAEDPTPPRTVSVASIRVALPLEPEPVIEEPVVRIEPAPVAKPGAKGQGIKTIPARVAAPAPPPPQERPARRRSPRFRGWFLSRLWPSPSRRSKLPSLRRQSGASPPEPRLPRARHPRRWHPPSSRRPRLPQSRSVKPAPKVRGQASRQDRQAAGTSLASPNPSPAHRRPMVGLRPKPARPTAKPAARPVAKAAAKPVAKRK